MGPSCLSFNDAAGTLEFSFHCRPYWKGSFCSRFWLPIRSEDDTIYDRDGEHSAG